MKNFLVVALTVAILSGCATGMKPYFPSAKIIKAPAEREVTQRSLGEALMEYASLEQYPALVVTKSEEHANGLIKFTFLSNPMPFLGMEGSRKVYGPSSTKVYNLVDRSWATSAWNYRDHGIDQLRQLATWNITLREDISAPGVFTYKIPMTYVTNASFKGEVERTTVLMPSGTSFRQELLYNGRVGDGVRITYREYSGDMLRPAFSQEAVYDLSESDIVAFKDARLRILEATNSHLKYEVLSHFTGVR